MKKLKPKISQEKAGIAPELPTGNGVSRETFTTPIFDPCRRKPSPYTSTDIGRCDSISEVSSNIIFV
jgi:hypothetical protein